MPSKLLIANLADQYDSSIDDNQRRLLAATISGFMRVNKDHEPVGEAVTWQQATKLFADTSFYHGGVALYQDKIPVIKFARTLNGLSLKETKDWVEANIPRLAPRSF